MARSRALKKLAMGSGVLAVVGGGVGATMYRKRLQQNKAVTAADYNAAQDKEQLSAALAWVRKAAEHRAAASALESCKGPSLELFRYTTCPFCGKAKAFLDYHGIEHEAIEVDPMFKSQIAGSAYQKLPQLRFGGKDGVCLVDSELIVDTLAELVGSGSQLQDPEVQKWRAWARDSLVRHVTLNINKTLIGAWRGYSYIDAFETIPLVNKLFLKVVGAPVMFMVAKYKTYPTLVKAGEIKEGDDVRAAFHEQVEHFVLEVKLNDKKPFHGGSKPDLADLDVYGVFQSVRGHEIFDDLLQNTAIGPWMMRMDRETGKAEYRTALA